MKILKMFDGFFGTRSVSKEFEKVGFEVHGIEMDSQFRVDDPNMIIGDILKWDYKSLYEEGSFDVVWMSPPCTGFSVASIGTHWLPGYVPKTDTARMGIKLLEKAIEISKYLCKPDGYIYMENPRGMMRKMPQVQHLKKATVTYCQYGDFRMKPTDIFHSRMPRDMPILCCKNGDPCHESAPRGSRKGTQGLKNKKERARLPEDFCVILAESTLAEIEGRDYRSDIKNPQPGLKEFF